MGEYRKQQKDTTLWDGDWLDGNTKTDLNCHDKKKKINLSLIIFLLLCSECRMELPVNEQSKAMLQAAILNDTRFLTKCNIMDYSLLVGVDKEKYEMTVGIVGMFSLLKTCGPCTFKKKNFILTKII